MPFLHTFLDKLFPSLPRRKAAWSPSLREALAAQCVIDSVNRTATGMPIYLVYWVIYCFTADLWRKEPTFAWVNLGLTATFALIRLAIFFNVRKLLRLGVPVANACVCGAILMAALHWGVLTGLCLSWASSSAESWLMLSVSSALIAGGCLSMCINPSLRLGYPFAVYAPITVGTLVNFSAHNLALLTMLPMFAVYILRTSTVVLSDYWHAAVSRADAEQRAQEMEQASITDSLTGVLNRHGVDRALADCWRRARRQPAGLALLMIDIDRFKGINDTHGHALGDECIKAAADAVKQCTRLGVDIVGRFGGDEFVVILPGSDAKGATATAERVLARVRQARVDASGGAELAFTCSIGIAAVSSGARGSPQDTLRRADEALYAAKRQGRDQYAICERLSAG